METNNTQAETKLSLTFSKPKKTDPFTFKLLSGEAEARIELINATSKIFWINITGLTDCKFLYTDEPDGFYCPLGKGTTVVLSLCDKNDQVIRVNKGAVMHWPDNNPLMEQLISCQHYSSIDQVIRHQDHLSIELVMHCPDRPSIEQKLMGSEDHNQALMGAEDHSEA